MVTVKTRSMGGAHAVCPGPRNSRMREAVSLLFYKQELSSVLFGDLKERVVGAEWEEGPKGKGYLYI